MDSKTRFLVSVDPGDVNNGFCFFSYNTETKIADTKVMSVLDNTGLDNYLKTIWLTVSSKIEEKPEIIFAVENFRTRKDKIFQWNEVITVRNIGKVQMLASWLDAKCFLQEPGQVWPMARKWAPFPIKKHPEDDKSAWCHGANLMMNLQWIRTVDQITFFGQERL